MIQNYHRDVYKRQAKAGGGLDEIRLHLQGDVKVKAAGGVRTLDDALAMIEAGAERIGTSAGVPIVEEFKTRFEKG